MGKELYIDRWDVVLQVWLKSINLIVVSGELE